MRIIKTGVAKIDASLQKNDLEAIHEETYKVEAAGEFLKDKNPSKKIKKFLYVLEEIHEASEERDANEIKENIGALKSLSKDLD